MSVFLSYAEEDELLVHRIFYILDRMGLEPYAYKLFQDAGEILEYLIVERIRRCRVLLPFLTVSGISSAWVHQEIGVARAFDKLIVPVLQQALTPPGFVYFRIHIPYTPLDPDRMIYEAIRRMQGLLNPQKITMQCNCGNELRVDVPSPREIDDLLARDPSLVFKWDCSCGRALELRPLTLEQLPQPH